MPETKNLNVAPYFDDFNEDNNFVRTLFGAGFAIQARERLNYSLFYKIK